MESAIQWINHYPLDTLVSLILFQWIAIYPIENAIHLLNNQVQITGNHLITVMGGYFGYKFTKWMGVGLYSWVGRGERSIFFLASSQTYPCPPIWFDTHPKARRGMFETKMASHKTYVKRGKGTHDPKAQMAGAYPGFLSMKYAQEYCYYPLDGMLVYLRVTFQQ